VNHNAIILAPGFVLNSQSSDTVADANPPAVSVLVPVRFGIQCCLLRRDALGATARPLHSQDNAFWCAWVHKRLRRLIVSCSVVALHADSGGCFGGCSF